MYLEQLCRWGRAQRRLLVYAAVAGIVTIWTLLRFFTKPAMFDLVSQQVVVHQWLHGGMSAAHMGQTAYVLKMLFLYVPLDLLPGAPRLKLILLTLAINITTFVLIGLLAERLLRAYRVRIGGIFYAALLWLSVIAGSVFWIQFANSRNLEVAGGLLLLYLGVRFLEWPTRKLAIVIALFGGLLFFGDPLQVFMTALPLVVYAGVLVGTKGEAVQTTGALCGLVVVAFGVSKLLFMITGHWLHLTFTNTGGVGSPDISGVWLVQSVLGAIKASVSLLAGANDAGRLRESVNLCLLLLGVAGILYGAIRRLVPHRLLLLVACVWTVDTLIYIASGQAVQGSATSRYLIMIAPALLLLFGAVRLPKGSRVPVKVVVASALLVNTVALGVALTTHWDTAFPQDAHLASVQRFVRQNPGMSAYASTDTAMSAQYLYTVPANRLLPVACLDGALVRTHFSMDKEFAARAANRNSIAAIIFDGNIVSNTPNVCTTDETLRQFGTPEHTGHTDDGSVVLYYPQQVLQLRD